MTDVAQIARRWVGTPYQHQASLEGIGADCLGLVLGIWRDIYGVKLMDVAPYTPDWTEVSGHEVLLDTVSQRFDAVPLGDMKVGDLLVFRMRKFSVAKHLGIVSALGPLAKIIHAYSGRGVVETPLNAVWERRIAGVFRFPDRSI